ncbi:MAG: hypothetical protein AB7O67_05110 [Vicinamibacterales bacterium]
MFIGHYGVALAAKRAAPRRSLGTYVTASVFIDLLWPVLLLAGVEHVEVVPGLLPTSALAFTSYPISHSLVMTIAWGVLFGGVVLFATRDRAGALVAGGLVVSHWLLDLLVHIPDLPIWPGGPLAGFGAWRSVGATLVLELGTLFAGFAIYLSATSPRDRLGRILPWFLPAMVTTVWLGGLFGPPPPDWQTIAWSANLQWLFVAFAWWMDRHRAGVSPS